MTRMFPMNHCSLRPCCGVDLVYKKSYTHPATKSINQSINQYDAQDSPLCRGRKQFNSTKMVPISVLTSFNVTQLDQYLQANVPYNCDLIYKRLLQDSHKLKL